MLWSFLFMDAQVKEIHSKVEKELPVIESIFSELQKRIIGQEKMLQGVIIGLLTNGHILIEGVPGLAKTMTIKTLSDVIDLGFKRIQFTPDLLPSDIIGTLIYNQKENEFKAKLGPIFANLILAYEINRAPAKVQSALLEAMQERQVTIGDKTYKLPDPFLVMSTQNPIETEGTYPLPEAQLDRFMMKVKVTYPFRNEESLIVDRITSGKTIELKPVITPVQVIAMQKVVDKIYVDENIK